MLRSILPRALRAADTAVLWRLGLVRVDPVGADSVPAPESAEGFWRPRTDTGRLRADALRRRHAPRGVTVVDLDGPSSGPGWHRGSRHLSGRAWLRDGAASGTPLVLILHGFAAPAPYYEEHHARRLLRAGAHAARLELPFHMRRRPRGAHAGDGYFSTDLAWTREVLRQSVEDAAAVVEWARREVTPRVAVLGFSLGGLVACLLATRTSLDSVVAVTPPCDLPAILLERAPLRTRRRVGLLEGGGGPWAADGASAQRVLADALAPVVPRTLPLRTPRDRVALVAAEHDQIVGAACVRELAQAWGVECWNYGLGHMTVMAARGLEARIRERLLRTEEAPAPALAADAPALA